MARHPDDVQVQVLMTPEMRKALAKTVLANQDDVPRKKLMDRGPMILYAMSWFMAQPKEDQLAILLKGKAEFDAKFARPDSDGDSSETSPPTPKRTSRVGRGAGKTVVVKTDRKRAGSAE